MSFKFTRSTTGCFVCKTKRKKCDETKPQCLRCQKSNTICPGYTIIKNPNKPNRKPRTLLAPRTRVGRSRTTVHQQTPPETSEKTSLHQGQLPTIYGPVNFEASSSELGPFVVEDVADSSRTIDRPDLWSLSIGTPQRSSIYLSSSHRLADNTSNLDPFITTSSTNTATPLTSGQSSLLTALFSLSQPPDPLHSAPSSDLFLDSSVPLVPSWTSLNTAEEDTTKGSEHPEGVVSVICRQPVLDSTVESNGLPFALQNCTYSPIRPFAPRILMSVQDATWVRRMAFEPRKVAGIAREFVSSHFEEGGHSRWILSLVVLIGSSIGSVGAGGGKQKSMVSALQIAMRRRLTAVQSRPHPYRSELIKTLDSTLQTMLIHFYVTPFSEVTSLMQEAAPIFRHLCSELPNVFLPSLLDHPLHCLRQFAQKDIMFNVVMDTPTLFRYDVTIPRSQSTSPYLSVLSSQGEGITQWLHGIPNSILLLFAAMKTKRHDGFTPDVEVVASIEREIRELPLYNGCSSEPFLAIMRSVVQECWRQVAFVYLYMAVCGDPCDTPRVKRALEQYMNILDGVKPGRVPDEFLIMNFHLISVAAQQNHDREVIRQRVLGVCSYGKLFHTQGSFICIVDDCWARADSEGRPVVWSDVGVSRRRVWGV